MRKKLFIALACILFALVMISCDDAINENSVTVSTVAELKAAIADGSKTVYLGSDITLDETIDVNKTLTLDLGGKTISASTRAFHVKNGTLTIQNGTIESEIKSSIAEDYYNKSVIRVSDSTTGVSNLGLVLKADATINGLSCFGITAFGDNDATLDIYGTINSANACLAGSGVKPSQYNKGKITVNVYEGAKLTSYGATLESENGTITANESDSANSNYDDACGIYQPNVGGTLNIKGGTILSKKYSAVEVRNGVANISGGTLKSEAKEYKADCKTANVDGPTTQGVAVALNYYGKSVEEGETGATVNITDGTFDAQKVLAVVKVRSIDYGNATVKAVVSNVTLDDSKVVGTNGGNGTWTVATDK